MPDYSRRWCRLCDCLTVHWREAAPIPRRPALALVALTILPAWRVIEPWECKACRGSSRPWLKRRN
jgi:hypothetical protein